MVSFLPQTGHRPPLASVSAGEADAAVPVAVQVVLALLGEELHSAQKVLACSNGVDQAGVRDVSIQQVGLPSQLGRGVGVGVGNQGEAVQVGHPPVHRRIGGQAGLHGMDVGAKRTKALLHGIKAGEGPKHGKVRGPDMSWNELRLRAGVQG